METTPEPVLNGPAPTARAAHAASKKDGSRQRGKRWVAVYLGGLFLPPLAPFAQRKFTNERTLVDSERSCGPVCGMY